MTDEIAIGEEGPSPFTVRFGDGRQSSQCNWWWRVAVDRHLWCVLKRGHEGEHEYRVAKA